MDASSEQPNAQAWEIEYDYLKGTADILTHAKVSISRAASRPLR